MPLTLTVPLAASLALALVPGGQYILYPFKLFTTWVHECCHALMTILVGGNVRKITLASDTSGLTHYQIPPSRLREAMVASAGYLGSSIVGCLLYFLSQSRRFAGHERWLGYALGAMLLFTLAFWIRNLFGTCTVTLLAGAMFASTRPELSPFYREQFFAFLAIQTALNAVLDIRVLFGLDAHVRSDARTMQSVLWLPAIFWALLWLALSVIFAYWTIQSIGLPRL